MFGYKAAFLWIGVYLFGFGSPVHLLHRAERHLQGGEVKGDGGGQGHAKSGADPVPELHGTQGVQSG